MLQVNDCQIQNEELVKRNLNANVDIMDTFTVLELHFNYFVFLTATNIFIPSIHPVTPITQGLMVKSVML